MRASEDCHGQKKKAGQSFPHLLHSHLSMTTGERRDHQRGCNSLKFYSGKRWPHCTAVVWMNRQVSEGACETLFATTESDSLVILSLCRASKLLPGKPWGLPAVQRHPHSDVNLPLSHPPAQETVTWVKTTLVWQRWLKLGTNTHQWFKIFEEDLLISRVEKTILYKAPFPQKKFTLGL